MGDLERSLLPPPLAVLDQLAISTSAGSPGPACGKQVTTQAAAETVHDWFETDFHMREAGARTTLGMSWTHRQLSGLRHAKVSTPSGNRHFLALPGLLGRSFASGLRGACGFRWPCSVCPLPTCMPWSLSARSLAVWQRRTSEIHQQNAASMLQARGIMSCYLTVWAEHHTDREQHNQKLYFHLWHVLLPPSFSQATACTALRKQSVAESGALERTTQLLLSPCSSCPRPT